MEWFAEKATEIGMDELSFLDCRFSERRVIKCERIDKILISAVKQSHKAWKPVLNEMTSFERFVKADRQGDKFICHCYDQEDIGPLSPLPQRGEPNTCAKPFLMDVLRRGVETTVLIGPEGDFSIDEVKLAEKNGYRSVADGPPGPRGRCQQVYSQAGTGRNRWMEDGAQRFCRERRPPAVRHSGKHQFRG